MVSRQALHARKKRAEIERSNREYLDSERGYNVIIDLGALIKAVRERRDNQDKGVEP